MIKKINGQALILTVMVLGSVMIGTTVIAGMLIKNQLRQSVGVIESNQALFAADAGLEWEMYRFFVNNSAPQPTIMLPGVSFQTCSPVGTVCPPPFATATIRSIGSSGQSSRAFEVVLQ